MAYQSEVEKLEQRYRENPDQWFAALADAYRKGGDLDLALDVVRAGLEKRPNYVSGHIVLGRCFLDKKDDGEALRSFQRVLELDGENVIALKALGEVCGRMGQTNEAVRWLTRLLEVDPTNDEAEQELGRLKAETGRQAAAASTPVEIADPALKGGVGDVGTLEGMLPRQEESPSGVEPESPSPEEPRRDVLETTGPGSGGPDQLRAAALPGESDAFPVERASTPDAMPSETTAARSGWDMELETSGPALRDVPTMETAPEPGEPLVEKEASEVTWESFVGDESAPPAVGSEPGSGIPETLAAPGPDAMPASAWDVPERSSEPEAASESGGPDAEPAEAMPFATEAVTGPVDEDVAAQARADSGPGVEADVGTQPEPSTGRGAGGEVPVAGLVSAFEVSQPPDAEAMAEPPREAEGSPGGLPLIMPDEVGAEAGATGAATEDSASVGAPSEPEPVVTETMAELYARQGLLSEARDIYRQLLAQRPGDENLARRLGELERRPERQGAARAGGPERLSASETGGPSVRDLLAGIFGPAPPGAVKPSPPPASRVVEPTPLESAFGGTGSTASGAPGEPTRQASDEVSLASVFGDEPPPVAPPRPAPPAKGGGGEQAFSFDEFFGNPPQPAPPASGHPPRETGASDDDDEFKRWLKGLKS